MAFRDSSTVFVKKARGAMVRYIVQQKAVTPTDLQGFTGDRGSDLDLLHCDISGENESTHVEAHAPP